MQSALRTILLVAALMLFASCDTGDGRSNSAVESPGPAWTSARTSKDGMSIVLVFTGGATYDPTDPCSVDYRADVEEGDDAVTIGLVAIQRSTASSSGDAQDVVCLALGYPRQLDVELQQPLGSRSLVDAATGSSTPPFDGTMLLEPTWVPEGWLLRSEGSASPTASPAQVWSRGWSPPTGDPFACTPTIALLQGDRAAVELASDALGFSVPGGNDDVNGATATHALTAAGFHERLVWTSGDLAFAVIGSSCEDAIIGFDSVLRFARSIR